MSHFYYDDLLLRVLVLQHFLIRYNLNFMTTFMQKS